jgi:hypothetical protein
VLLLAVPMAGLAAGCLVVGNVAGAASLMLLSLALVGLKTGSSMRFRAQ